MRVLKLVSYVIAAVSMGYYRLLKQHASISFNNREVEANAEYEGMVPYGARHMWIPLGNEDELSVWLVAPKGKYMLADKANPIVVMAHGFGNQKDMGLFPYAEAFSEDGIAALVIDYRTCGGSSRNRWKMRNYINPSHHVQDIISAVHFIRSGALFEDNIDEKMIALWGTAFAGGHVVMAAEILGPDLVKGVVSQSPHLDGRALAWRSFSSRGIIGTIQFASLATTDFLRSALWLSPLYVKIISDNTTDISFLSVSSKELKIYFKKHPKKYVGGWENKAPARSFFLLPFYNPISHVKNVKVN
jgi:pimeloyl-ACP methyl ester carboxylesterase